MNKRNRPIESEPLRVESFGGIDIVDVPGTAMETVAVLDPPESGPPTVAELGLVDADNQGATATKDRDRTLPPESTPVPDYTSIVANLDGQTAPAWPTSSPFKVDWPWGGEPDPVPGDVLGWNWSCGEIAVVTAAPEITTTWPYTLTVEIQPMPEEWRQVKVFDLNSGQQLDVEWFTRWNRAYSQFDQDAGAEAKRTTGSGWLAVVREQADQEKASR